jgi:tRNA 2-thiouridine synthesizing protein E
MELKVGEKNIEFDKDGFMLEPNLWDEEVACLIAREEGIEEMSDDHWRIANFIREYWKANGLAPTVRLLCRDLGMNVRQIFKLYTSGPARGACRVAGLPKPDGCV